MRGFIYKRFKIVMALIDKIGNTPPPPKNIENSFTLEEVDIIIRVLGSASFPVKEIEPLYRAIYKLQELRTKLKQQYDATQTELYNR